MPPALMLAFTGWLHVVARCVKGGQVELACCALGCDLDWHAQGSRGPSCPPRIIKGWKDQARGLAAAVVPQLVSRSGERRAKEDKDTELVGAQRPSRRCVESPHFEHGVVLGALRRWYLTGRRASKLRPRTCGRKVTRGVALM
ncbi:hypothetical protein EV126DRAFT_412307, partial [Verticillium dahliae]